ncbi:MAG: cysteine desulfurase [Ktedonobacteraceae bacterium]
MSTLTQLQRIRQEMPATTSHIYLNTGTFGPLHSSVIQAMEERVRYEWRNGRQGSAFFENMMATYGSARRRVGTLLNADEREIVLTHNTGEGLNVVSYGIDWHAGDEVITTNHEHINALGPLYQIRDRYNITIRIADLGESAQRPVVEAVQELVTPRTRLIDVSHVTWTTGTVLDIQALGRFGREKHIPTLIDGAQSAGNIPVDVKDLDVDFYAIPLQKWLCGPDGAGSLYIRQEAMHYVTPTYVGYLSIKHEPGAEWDLHVHAQRFEPGGHQSAAVAGIDAALKWLEEGVGYAWIFERISTLQAYAYKKLQEVPGLTILTPVPGASGILSFTLQGRDDGEIVTKLREQHNIFIRNIPSIKALRISTGFYNTEEDIDALASALRHI